MSRGRSPLFTLLPRRILLGNLHSYTRIPVTVLGRRQAGLISELPRETVWKVLSGCSGGLRSALWRAKDTLRICPTMNGVASVRICLVPQGKDAPGFTAYGRS